MRTTRAQEMQKRYQAQARARQLTVLLAKSHDSNVALLKFIQEMDDELRAAKDALAHMEGKP